MTHTNIKMHFTHKWRISKLFKEGFSDEELAIMYHVPWSEIKRITRGLEQVERI